MPRGSLFSYPIQHVTMLHELWKPRFVLPPTWEELNHIQRLLSGNLLSVNQGTLYPVLLRLEQEGAVASEWGPSENNRRARFYRLTRAGHALLETEKRDWEQTKAIIARFFEVKAEDLL